MDQHVALIRRIGRKHCFGEVVLRTASLVRFSPFGAILSGGLPVATVLGCARGLRQGDKHSMNSPSSNPFNELFLRHQKDVFAYILSLSPDRTTPPMSISRLVWRCWKSSRSTIRSGVLSLGVRLRVERSSTVPPCPLPRASATERRRNRVAGERSIQICEPIEGQLDLLKDCLASLPADKRETLMQCYSHQGKMKDLAAASVSIPTRSTSAWPAYAGYWSSAWKNRNDPATVCSMISPEEQSDSGDSAELWALAEAVCNGTIEAAQFERLNELLSADEDAARRYATYVRMHGLLLWECQDADVSPPVDSPPTIVIQTSPLPALDAPSLAGLFSPGSFLFSYSLAAVFMAIGLLVALTYRNRGPSVAGSRSERLGAERESRPTGERTLVCRPNHRYDGRLPLGGPKTATIPYAYVPLGRKYALASGLMKITTTGAKIVLQGPCTYRVDSKTGGNLELGRLTAELTQKGEGGRGKGEGSKAIQTPVGKSRIAASPSLCAVRFPPSPFPLPPSLSTLRPPSSRTLARNSASR